MKTFYIGPLNVDVHWTPAYGFGLGVLYHRAACGHEGVGVLELVLGPVSISIH